ncbi:MAG: IS21 family transposase, partial [Variovorax sp.]
MATGHDRAESSVTLAGIRTGISERSARRIESAVTLPSQKTRRYWRSRPDPFVDVWDTQIVP